MRTLSTILVFCFFVVSVSASETWNLTAIADSTVDAINPDATGAAGDLIVQKVGPGPGNAGAQCIALKNCYVQFQLPDGVKGSDLTKITSANITLNQKSGNSGLLLYAYMIKDGLDTASCDTYTWNMGIGFNPAYQAAVMDGSGYYDPAKANWFGAMSTYSPGPINMYYTSGIDGKSFTDLIKEDTDGRITVFFGMYQYWNYEKDFASIEDGTLPGPVLTIEGVPEPASLILLGLGGLLMKKRSK